MPRTKKLKAFELESNRCWCCGIVFSEISNGKDDDCRTKHHAIPSAMKPIINVLIPICLKCHRELHDEMTKANAIKTKIRGLSKYITDLQNLSEK